MYLREKFTLTFLFVCPQDHEPPESSEAAAAGSSKAQHGGTGSRTDAREERPELRGAPQSVQVDGAAGVRPPAEARKRNTKSLLPSVVALQFVTGFLFRSLDIAGISLSTTS